jgi:hypothetical protein
MKKILITLCFIFLYSAIAKEGYMCSYYYDSIIRKVNIIEQKKSDLSNMALKKLYNDLTFEVNQCFSNCEGKKFNYCNKVAKEIEK